MSPNSEVTAECRDAHRIVFIVGPEGITENLRVAIEKRGIKVGWPAGFTFIDHVMHMQLTMVGGHLEVGPDWWTKTDIGGPWQSEICFVSYNSIPFLDEKGG